MGAAAHSLELELTESILMHDMESSIEKTLKYLRELGFRSLSTILALVFPV